MTTPDPTSVTDELAAMRRTVHILDTSRTRLTAEVERTTDTHGRVPYQDLEPHERVDLHDWCHAHKLDPAVVPIDPHIEQDGDEWRIQIYALRGGRHYLGPDGEIATVTVRRAVVAPLTWRTPEDSDA